MYEQLSLGVICSFFNSYKFFCNPKQRFIKETIMKKQTFKNKFNFNFVKEMQAYRKACQRGNHSEWKKTFLAAHSDIFKSEILKDDFYHFLISKKKSNVCENVCLNTTVTPIMIGLTVGALKFSESETTNLSAFIGLAIACVLCLIPTIIDFHHRNQYIDDIISSVLEMSIEETK